LAQVILIPQCTKTENLAQRCNIVIRGDYVIKNAVYRRDGHLTKAFQKEKNITLQVNCWIFESNRN